MSFLKLSNYQSHQSLLAAVNMVNKSDKERIMELETILDECRQIINTLRTELDEERSRVKSLTKDLNTERKQRLESLLSAQTSPRRGTPALIPRTRYP